MRVIAWIGLAATLATLTACTYAYKPKEGEVPAYIATRGERVGELQDTQDYSLDVTGMNGATFSMIPAQLDDSRPQEMPLSPGPAVAKIFMTWPRSSMGKHVKVPFVALPGEHYRFTFGKEGEKLAATLLDSKGKVAQKLTFTLVRTTTYMPAATYHHHH